MSAAKGRLDMAPISPFLKTFWTAFMGEIAISTTDRKPRAGKTCESMVLHTSLQVKNELIFVMEVRDGKN